MRSLPRQIFRCHLVRDLSVIRSLPESRSGTALRGCLSGGPGPVSRSRRRRAQFLWRGIGFWFRSLSSRLNVPKDEAGFQRPASLTGCRTVGSCEEDILVSLDSTGGESSWQTDVVLF